MDSFQVMREQSGKMVPENVAKIEITTKNSLAVAHDGFQKIMSILENVKKEIIAAAQLFREENINEASFKIIKILETIKPIAIFINSVSVNFYLNIDQIPFDAKITLREKVEKFLETIDELVDAQEEQDYVKLADYLEFRLVEDMNDLNKIVHLLLQKIDAIGARDREKGKVIG
ncbi:MAG: hypothetical protein MUF15_22195 [Acidobacteria bacterium]|nr:hypothetical protein [Acidobacteriota bacterium]